MSLVSLYFPRILSISSVEPCIAICTKSYAVTFKYFLRTNTATWVVSSPSMLSWTATTLITVALMKTAVIWDMTACRLVHWYHHLWDSTLLQINWKPLTKRSQGRPTYRWEDNIKQDIRQMKIKKNWIACVQDRGKWKEVVEKAKTFN